MATRPNGTTSDLEFEGEGAAKPKAPTPEEQRANATRQLAEMIGAAVSQAMGPLAERMDRMEGGRKPVAGEPEGEEGIPSPQDYYRDPIGVTRQLIQREGLKLFQAEGGVARDLAVRTATDRAIEKIRASDPVSWAALEPDFRREVGRIPGERLAQVNEDSGESGAEQFFYYMKGRPQFARKLSDAHTAATEKAEKEERSSRYVRAPYVEVGGARQGGAPITTKGLSQEQITVADKMGLTPDQYAQSLRSIESGEPLFPPKKPPKPATEETVKETS